MRRGETWPSLGADALPIGSGSNQRTDPKRLLCTGTAALRLDPVRLSDDGDGEHVARGAAIDERPEPGRRRVIQLMVSGRLVCVARACYRPESGLLRDGVAHVRGVRRAVDLVRARHSPRRHVDDSHTAQCQRRTRRRRRVSAAPMRVIAAMSGQGALGNASSCARPALTHNDSRGPHNPDRPGARCPPAGAQARRRRRRHREPRPRGPRSTLVRCLWARSSARARPVPALRWRTIDGR
jgi:hypothetical protein